ncbi:metallophosphoesterase [Clostridium sp.]|uniref:metallophosphoesterase n=1 Tax=Clostridium sp. TaxID=1506 RepID=UPI00261A12EB|nr:metallophosphoesterase [Clostridium sp.]
MKIKENTLTFIYTLFYLFLNFLLGLFSLKALNHLFHVNSIIFWTIFFVLSLSSILTIYKNTYKKGFIYNSFYKIGSYWISFFAYSIIAVPILLFLETLINKFNKTLGIKLIPFIFLYLIYILIALLGSIKSIRPKITRYDITLSKSLKNDLNLVLVSDIHLGNIVKNKSLIRMVNEINLLNPDLVLIAGDIIDSTLDPFLNHDMAKEFKNIKSVYGTFAALGNHDFMSKSLKDLIRLLEANSVKVLRDEAILIDDDFYVIGRDDITVKHRLKKPRKPLEELLLPLDKSKALILIDHNPGSITDSLNLKIDLQLSGHTHKGQISPLNFLTKKYYEIDYGYLNKDDYHIIVSSGFGTYGPPIRLGSKSEIVQVTLKGKE